MVQHDMDALKQRSGAEWRPCIRRAHALHRVALRLAASGASASWSVPVVDDDNVVSMYEGNTNLFWAKRYGERAGLVGLWLKLCGNTHTGSFKDLGMTVLVSVVKQMRARGPARCRAVACASTGDTSAALAAYAAYAEIPRSSCCPRPRSRSPS